MTALTLTNLTKRFDAGTVGEKLALADFSLEVRQGDFITILGSNGAGKSTLFNAILGKFRLDGGQVMLGGKDITRWPDFRRALYIGCLYQNPMRGTAPSMTIEENLALAYNRKTSRSFFAVNRKDSAYFREVLASLDLGLETRMKTKMGLLSGGQRQVAALIMAVIAKPDLLLLDEHTAALDVSASQKVLEVTRRMITENKLNALMITHDIHQALSCGNRTIMLDGGRLVRDIPDEERQSLTPQKLTELFLSSVKAGVSDRTLFSV